MKLYHGDCLKILDTEIEDNTMDAIVTSIPYNIGVPYEGYDDSKSREYYLNFLTVVFLGWNKKLAESGSIFINVGTKPTSPYLPFQIIPIMMTAGFTLQNTFHWIKSINIDGVTKGHSKPINSERFVNDQQEYIFHFSKHGTAKLDRLAVGVPYVDLSNIDRWSSGSSLRCRGNTWYVPYKTRTKKLEHPATFPIEIPLMCLKILGKNVKTVLDPFMGLGTVGLACKELHQEFIGIELVEKYYEIARKTLEAT